MHRNLFVWLIAALLAIPVAAQTTATAQSQETLVQAQQVVAAAETAGAATYAKSIYDEAQWRVQFARENWSAEKRDRRDQARLRAEQALWAARAALAKAQWLGTNSAIRNLQSDIVRFGGRSELRLEDEPAAIDFARGNTSKTRIIVAQTAVDQAKAVGAEQIVGNDLKPAEANLRTARLIVRGNANSESADHLAFVAEMMARRAYYLARLLESTRNFPSLQLERTRLAQAESERMAASERAQREQAQRATEELQRQLVAEQTQRQAEAAEVTRLRQQIGESRRMMQQRIEQDRAARVAAEQQLDSAFARYESSFSSASTSDVDSLRRQVEDQQIALRAIQERERLNEQAIAAEVESLRRDLDGIRTNLSPQVISERDAIIANRQQQLEMLRREREADLAHRTELERQQQAAAATAQRRRQEAESQAQQLQEQVAAAQQAAQVAQQAAQLTQAELERARQQTAQTQAELEKARQELATRETESRRAQMEQELARLASTKTDSRGLIVTLPGIFFDTGKSEVKSGSKNTLTRIAEQLKSDDTIRIAVEGHSDSVGSDESNQKLSEQRATAVRDALVQAGISADRVTAAGRGEANPIATNKTAAGRQQNRRVELIITNK